MKISGYETHPAAALFPMLSEGELASLAEDIRQRGLLHPVILHDDRVLDGRNRLAACGLAGIKPRFLKWRAEGTSPVEWAISSNLKRRHLSKGQQVAVAIRA